MPQIIQLKVMDQTTAAGGVESCGYHTLKNSLLALMHLQGIIDEQQFASLREDRDLFQVIYDKTLRHDNNLNTDVSLPTFMKLLAQVKNGDFDFSAHGLSTADLTKLNLTPDGTQNITVANYEQDVHAPGYGLGGMDEDLLVAAATVKLARSKGGAQHVFALGLDNRHWVTAAVSQDAQGARSWYFMDSWHNQARYQKSVINKIEEILAKDEQQLNAYLVSAYKNAHAPNLNRYTRLLNPVDGLPLPGDEAEVQQRFNLVAPELTIWLEQRFNFMQESGWLDAPAMQEKEWITRLYHMAAFLNSTTPSAELKKQLAPICARLETIVTLALLDEAIDENSEQEHQPGPQQDEADENLKEQQRAALQAVNEGQPKATEGIIARFVKGIKFIWEGIKSAVDYVARAVGLVQ